MQPRKRVKTNASVLGLVRLSLSLYSPSRGRRQTTFWTFSHMRAHTHTARALSPRNDGIFETFKIKNVTEGRLCPHPSA